MKKSDISNMQCYIFVIHISILIVVISLLAIVNLDNHRYVKRQKSTNIISNSNDFINDKKKVLKKLKKI